MAEVAMADEASAATAGPSELGADPKERCPEVQRTEEGERISGEILSKCPAICMGRAAE